MESIHLILFAPIVCSSWPHLRWFMCSGILFVGLLAALLDGDLQLGVPPKVVMGGALWAFSNFVPWCWERFGAMPVVSRG